MRLGRTADRPTTAPARAVRRLDPRPATVAVTSGRPPHEADSPLNTPITMASTYVAGGDVEYGRYGNPTWSAFEEALGDLEGGRARVLLRAGGGRDGARPRRPGRTVVAPRHAYNGT